MPLLSYVLGVALISPFAAAPGADHGGVDFVYQAPADSDCPSARTVRRSIAARLGYDPFTGTSTRRIALHLARDGDELSGTLEVAGAGQRVLRSKDRDCRELVGALELAAALAIDPLAASSPAIGIADREPEAGEQPVEPLEVEAGLAVQGGVGFAPRPGWGLTTEARARWARFSLGVTGRADFPSTLRTHEGAVETSLLTLGVSACAHRGALAACALVAAGTLRGAAVGLSHPKQASLFHGSAGGRLGWEHALGARTKLRGGVELTAPWVRSTLKVADEPVWTSPAVAATAGLGIFVKL